MILRRENRITTERLAETCEREIERHLTYVQDVAGTDIASVPKYQLGLPERFPLGSQRGEPRQKRRRTDSDDANNEEGEAEGSGGN